MNTVRVVPVMAILILVGCNSRPERVGAPIEGYNHTSAAINSYSVNGSGGPNLSPHHGGGSQTCCAGLPVKWQPGMTVIIEWEKDPDPMASRYLPHQSDWKARNEAIKAHQAKYTRHRAVVKVAPYEALGVVTVHFLPCDEVKVAAGATRPNLATHPYKYPLRMEEPSQCTNH